MQHIMPLATTTPTLTLLSADSLYIECGSGKDDEQRTVSRFEGAALLYLLNHY